MSRCGCRAKMPKRPQRSSSPRRHRGIRAATKRIAVADVKATGLARGPGQRTPGHLTPQAIAAKAKQQFKNLPVKVTVWDEQRLAKESMGGIVEVGQGRTRPG